MGLLDGYNAKRFHGPPTFHLSKWEKKELKKGRRRGMMKYREKKRNNRCESGAKKKKGLTDLRDDALRQGPPIHFNLVLHVLDLLLQCVLVHVGEYTGIHGYSRASLFPDNSRIALAPLRKINRTDYVWGLLLLEHQTYVTHWQQEIRFCEEKCTYFFPHRDLRKKITLWISFFVSRTRDTKGLILLLRYLRRFFFSSVYFVDRYIWFFFFFLRIRRDIVSRFENLEIEKKWIYWCKFVYNDYL